MDSYPEAAVERLSLCSPKKGDLNEMKNWSPGSLLCNYYKLLSKVMANRLGDVLDQIIHPDQTYCVPGRRIADNIYL